MYGIVFCLVLSAPVYPIDPSTQSLNIFSLCPSPGRVIEQSGLRRSVAQFRRNKNIVIGKMVKDVASPQPRTSISSSLVS